LTASFTCIQTVTENISKGSGQTSSTSELVKTTMKIGASTLIEGDDVSVPRPLFGVAHDALTLAQFLSRPVRVQTWSVTPAFVETPIFPFDLWITTSTIRDKLRHFRLLRGKPKITIMVNSYPFNYGQMAVAADYTLGITEGYTNYIWANGPDMVQCLQAPNTLIDLGRSAIYEMSLDWVTKSGWHDITGGDNFLGPPDHHASQYFPQLTPRIVAPLRTVQDAAPVSVGISVFMSLDDAEVSGSVKDNAISSLAYQSAFADEKFSGKLERMSVVMEDVAKIPPLSAMATPAAIALKMGGKVAKMLGYSTPEGSPEGAVITNQYGNHFSYSDQKVYEPKLTSFPGQGIAVSAASAGVGADGDMLISDIVQRYGLIALFDWSVSGVNSSIFLAPTDYPSGPPLVGMASTPMKWVSDVFNYWNGSLKYRIEVIASPFHRGVLGITVGHHYDITGIDPDVVMTQQETYYIDLSSDTKVLEIEIPFLSSLSALGVRVPMGIMTFYEAIPLASESGATVTIKVEACAGKDFNLFCPTMQEFMDHSWLLQSDDGEVPQVDVAVSSHTMGIEQLDDGYNSIVFGEKFTSIKQLMDKHVLKTAFSKKFEAEPVSYHPQVEVVLPVPIPLQNLATQVWNSTSLSRLDYWFNGMSYVDYFKPGFIGYRGGFKYKVMQAQTIGSQQMTNAPASVGLEWTRGAGNTPLVRRRSTVHPLTVGSLPSTAWGDCGSSTSLATYNPQMNNALEFYVPYVEPYAILGGKSLKNKNIVPEAFTADPTIVINLAGITTKDGVTPVLQIFEAAGDDFSLHKFMYVPKYALFASYA